MDARREETKKTALRNRRCGEQQIDEQEGDGIIPGKQIWVNIWKQRGRWGQHHMMELDEEEWFVADGQKV